MENLIDVTLEDTIRYVLTRKRMTGGNISEAQTVIITWETTGKRNKYFLTRIDDRKRLLDFYPMLIIMLLIWHTYSFVRNSFIVISSAISEFYTKIVRIDKLLRTKFQYPNNNNTYNNNNMCVSAHVCVRAPINRLLSGCGGWWMWSEGGGE